MKGYFLPRKLFEILIDFRYVHNLWAIIFVAVLKNR